MEKQHRSTSLGLLPDMSTYTSNKLLGPIQKQPKGESARQTMAATSCLLECQMFISGT